MYPLPHGVMGQYFAHQQSSAFGHAPRPAAGAEAAAFATEGHHAFRVRAVIAHHQESVLKTAAFQVILELPLDIPWQIRALCRQIGHESGLRYPSRLVRKVILTEYRYPLCITMIKGGVGTDHRGPQVEKKDVRAMEGMQALWFFATYRITALGDSLASHKGFVSTPAINFQQQKSRAGGNHLGAIRRWIIRIVQQNVNCFFL